MSSNGEIFVFLMIISFTNAKILIIPDNELTSCENFLRGQEIDLIDTSNLQIIRINEANSFYNGSIKFLKDFNKVPGRLLYEKLNHGEWSMQGFDGQYGDFCISYHDRMQPFYYTMDHFVKCPIEAGIEWVFNMVPFTLMALNIDPFPPHYVGRWRMVIVYSMRINGIKKYDCRRIHFEIVDTEKTKKSSAGKNQHGK